MRGLQVERSPDEQYAILTSSQTTKEVIGDYEETRKSY